MGNGDCMLILLDNRSNKHSDMVQTFLLLDTITNEETVKFLQLAIFTRHLDLQVPIILNMHYLPLSYKLCLLPTSSNISHYANYVHTHSNRIHCTIYGDLVSKDFLNGIVRRNDSRTKVINKFYSK